MKLTNLTVFKCALQWHEVHSPCCTTIIVHLQNSYHLANLKLCIPSPQLSLETTALLSVSLSLTTPGTSYKWDHTVFVLVCLAYFTEHNVLKIHPRCSMG